jgi:uncharacterized membrane protein
VHFDVAGNPDRWAERSTKGVYGVLLFATELCVWFVIAAIAGWFGARRGRMRSLMFGAMLGGEYFLGLMFALMALQALLNLPVWLVVGAPLVLLVPFVILLLNKMSDPGDPVEPTPNECWKGTIIYYNPNDSALFVEKRVGLGFTLNFGNRWSWVLATGLALVIASAFFVMA